METIKAHIDAAYEQLFHLTVSGDAKIPVGLAMAELTAAMTEIVEREKAGAEGDAVGADTIRPRTGTENGGRTADSPRTVRADDIRSCRKEHDHEAP